MLAAPTEAYEYRGTISEALAALDSTKSRTVFVAGGQSVMRGIKSRTLQPRRIVDL